MINLTPQLAVLAVLTTGIGVVMSRIGLRSGLLRIRHEQRRCPSCGCLVEARVCRRCGAA